MIALQRQRYNGVWIKEGETISVDTRTKSTRWKASALRSPAATTQERDYESRTMQARSKPKPRPKSR